MLTRTVAIHHVRAALHGARRRGLPPAPLLERAGIAPGLLHEDLARVSAQQFARLVRELWHALDDELLGLGHRPCKMGTFATMCRLAVYGGRDLRTALRRAADFYDLFPSGPRLRLVEPGGSSGGAGGAAADGTGGGAGEDAALELDATDFDGPCHFGTETTAVVAHRFAGWLVRRPVPLRRAEFAHPAPGHVLEYDLMFGAPCAFGTRRTALVFPRALLDAPVLQDEAGLRAFLRRAPDAILARSDFAGTASSQVRRLLGHALPGPLPSPEQIADLMAVSPQTLRRRLAAEGTSFQQVRDRTRRDHAIAVLAGGRSSIEQLSQELGFSEPSAFHRAFRRWTGSTPRAYQRGENHANCAQ
ncbi:AraC family transcriptional regulator [Streptomyces sp. JJ38]|uniref:AraC family transcriptional regulator n=1 Tax=Streptomyces sp. JJ38 TaxID=2738128 RepID=UPI001C59F847|nr:AraC family transcriptional regulator [Streptomyces sp. JJ38]MBW1598850.1 AraC family transcriptional regulator [Streptomyces sp. JJ38]